MAEQERVEELLLRWEAARNAGASLTVEQLCAQDPDLLPAVRQAIQDIVTMEQVLVGNDRDPTVITPQHEPNDHAAEGNGPFPQVPGYAILDLIDQGGMGVVYKARQLELGRTVAVKMMSDLRLAPKMVARFRTEAEAAARLQHPHIIQVFEVGLVKGRPFFSMEYVEGGSLGQRARQQRYSPRQAAELVETLARAVQAIHDSGIVHRDLKPANVMLTTDGQPKLADFGLAKRLNEEVGHTHTGEVLGTPSYMAPEQAQGEKGLIGPATDVYALGAILYELLAGQPPFQGANPLDSLRLVTTQDPPPPSSLVPGVPRDLEAICLKCLEKKPAHRYPAARLLAADLQRYLQGQTVVARPIGPVRRWWKWCRRHPARLALAIGAAALIVVPILLVLADQRAERRKQQQDLEAAIALKQEIQRKAIEAEQALRARALQVAPQVREILQRNCHECHGRDPKKIQRDLDILNHALLLDPKRRLVAPGDPEHSRLLQRIEDGSMPPEEEEESFPRVTQKELVLIKEWIVGGAPPLPPEDAAAKVAPVVTYSALAEQVKGIFQKHCYECHKYDEAKGGIKILHHRLLVNVRKVVLPGRPDESELYQLITSKDVKAQMPPSDYPRLSEAEIKTIRRWIEEGAPGFVKKE